MAVSRPDTGADRLDRGVEIVVFRGQQHDVVRAADPVGGRDLDRHREIAERAFDLEPALGERGGARTAHQKRDVAPGLGQPPAEIAADRTGPEHQETHINILCSDRRHSCADADEPAVLKLLQPLQHRLGAGGAVFARRLDVQLLDDTVIDDHRIALRADAHPGLAAVDGQPDAPR